MLINGFSRNKSSCIALIVVALLQGCSSPVQDGATQAPEISQQDSSSSEIPAFVRRLYPGLKRRLVLGYTEEITPQLSEYRARLDSSWLGYFGRWVTLDLLARKVEELTPIDLTNSDVVIIASTSSPSHVSFLGNSFPLSWKSNAFRFLGKVYDQPDDVLIMGQKQNREHGVYVLIGNDRNGLMDYITLVRSKGYHLFRNGKRVVTGSWNEEEPPWSLDPARHRDFESGVHLAKVTKHFRFYVYKQAIDSRALRNFAAEKERIFDTFESFWGARISAPPINYYLYKNFEDKCAFFGDFNTTYGFILPDVKHIDVERYEVHQALGPSELDADSWPREIILLARSVLGKPSSNFLETGFGVYFSKDWQGNGPNYWASRLYSAKLIPPLTELLDDERETYISRFVIEALSGSFVNYLLQTLGKEKFLAFYANWTLTEKQQKMVEKDWHLSLRKLADGYSTKIETARSLFPQPFAFQKGFNYQPNPGRYGYLTCSSDSSLARLSELGVNAVALGPYASMHRNYPNVLRPERRINGENDEAMVHAIQDAKSLGIMVMIKPQLYTNGWTGEIEMTNTADWDQFFFYYERWISHYALMAELYGAEILCIGTELVKATLQNESRWVALIDKLRELYSGKLVYASNWGQEFEKLTFWDRFDYIGLNNYYPLTAKDEPTDDELYQGAEAVGKIMEVVSQRFNRPILLTEIGFPGTVAPWKHPHRIGKTSDLAGKAQARGYEAWLRTLHGKSWLAGMYWWKWFSYDPKVNRSIDYVPQRKPTEKIIKEWYTKPW